MCDCLYLSCLSASPSIINNAIVAFIKAYTLNIEGWPSNIEDDSGPQTNLNNVLTLG